MSHALVIYEHVRGSKNTSNKDKSIKDCTAFTTGSNIYSRMRNAIYSLFPQKQLHLHTSVYNRTPYHLDPKKSFSYESSARNLKNMKQPHLSPY